MMKLIVFIISLMLSIVGIFVFAAGLIDPNVTKNEFLIFLLVWSYPILVTILTVPKD